MSPRRVLPVVVAAFGLLWIAQAVTGSSSSSARAAARPVAVAGEPVGWRRSMEKLRLPGRGCFHAAFPRVQWRKVPCVTPVIKPDAPSRVTPVIKPDAASRVPHPFAVGNGTDYAGEVTGTITQATGSFDSVTNVTSESGPVNANGPSFANAYSLQLNAKPFDTPACSGHGGCIGWQQFVYAAGDEQVFIQYWLIRYGPSCQAGWYSDGNDDCYTDGSNVASAPDDPIGDLKNLSIVGKADPAGNDSVMLFDGSSTPQATAANMGNMLNLGSAWKGVEFAVVGDCCSAMASFNQGATVVARTTIQSGTTNAPTCAVEGWTYETNNLNLQGPATVMSGSSPALIATESNASSSQPSCSSGQGVGDTHLTTFKGLLYDFQATGDFVLAQSPPNFVVQTRQVSGAPTWPNAAVNSAVATRIGATRVAICLPDQVEVNGRPRTVPQGNPLLLPGGVDLSRTGNAYLVRGPNGESVQAQVNPTWIDVSVGLARWPWPVRGLLANANGNVDQLATSNGTVLSEPVSFKELYSVYGQSWRVRPGQSILCGRPVKAAIPARPFYAQNLPAAVAQRARAVCLRAGVRKGALLDACTLDVAVIGRSRAARAYVGAQQPAAVGITP
jgi:von Willebrand factor type D domain